MARTFQRADYELKPLLRTLFLAEEFYRADLIRGQIKSPIQLTVQLMRSLNCELPSAGSRLRHEGDR